jgi:pyruvate dehydrogenase E1 component
VCDRNLIDGESMAAPNLEVLEEIQERVLWLSTRMIDHANQEDAGGIKVGGHQASCASMISIMTALWFGHITGDDKVAVKPHASPVYHSIKYLTGELDHSYLTTLRKQGGLQAYPSRTKDPDVSDFSTGSVGLGAVAPLFAAATRRYVDSHMGEQPPARFISVAGDAELDEGNVWEAIQDPALQGLGNFMLIIDLNRQSLDRVIPEMKGTRLMRFFSDAGWHVVEAKYGRKLEAAFERPNGEALRQRIDEMSNEEYQSLFAYEGEELRRRFTENADPAVNDLLADVPDVELAGLIQNLGGHDIDVLLEAYRECDAVLDKPSVVFAYTVKGWGLPFAGDPLNHSALLSPAQIDVLRSRFELDEDSEWDRFDPDSNAGQLCDRIGSEINNMPDPPRPELGLPVSSGAVASAGTSSTQEAFGRILVRLGRIPGVGERLVTASPDVAVSTNLGGWINSKGVFSPTQGGEFSSTSHPLKWIPGPGGQHVELGISEMNLFMLLGQLGMSHEHHGEMLLPVGTVYDPFVLRGLDALIYSLYNGSRFVVVGSPSGISLAPEGGAHQSTITPSVGLELPGLSQCEPAYAQALDWLLCDGLDGLSDPAGESLYLRLSTRPLDQSPFTEAEERIGSNRLRSDVLAGGYRLREPGRGDPVVLMASGAVMPEVLAAASLLEDEGIAATVVDVTSLDRVYRGWRRPLEQAASTASEPTGSGHLESLILAGERSAPIVTAHDSATHAMAWVGSVFGQRVVPIGVDRFGESGSIPELYGAFGLLPDQIATAAIVALSREI